MGSKKQRRDELLTLIMQQMKLTNGVVPLDVTKDIVSRAAKAGAKQLIKFAPERVDAMLAESSGRLRAAMLEQLVEDYNQASSK
jgi:6-phosphogluconolactonase/glucosamine-6-phosphate isomerase/deaminase